MTYNAGPPKSDPPRPNRAPEAEAATTISIDKHPTAPFTPSTNGDSPVAIVFEEASENALDDLLASLRDRGALRARAAPELECNLCGTLSYEPRDLLKHVRQFHEQDADEGWETELGRAFDLARQEQSRFIQSRGDIPGKLIGDGEEFAIHHGARGLGLNLNRLKNGKFPAIQVEAPDLGDFFIVWSKAESCFLVLYDPPDGDSSFIEEVAGDSRGVIAESKAPVTLAFAHTKEVSTFVSSLLDLLSGERHMTVGLGRVSWRVPWEFDGADVGEFDAGEDDYEEEEEE